MTTALRSMRRLVALLAILMNPAVSAKPPAPPHGAADAGTRTDLKDRYARALFLQNHDPEKAIELLREVVAATAPRDELHRRAIKLIGEIELVQR